MKCQMPLSLCFTVIMAASCVQPGDSGPEYGTGTDAQVPNWSKVVGQNYAHRSACQATIKSKLKLDNAGLPVPPDAKAGANNLDCTWDVFAWNSFAALNWPANVELGKRGLASSSATFLSNKDAGAETVWESFKEKRELFQKDPAKTWNDIEDGKEVKRFMKPENLWDQNGGYCTPEDQSRADTAASGPFAANKFHNQLDETAEVQSQALESLTDLCKGKTITGHNAQGEPECGINNESIVGPRVWMGTATEGRPLYYEVKVNYDFFDYVMNPPRDLALPSADSNLVNDEVAATNAMLGNIRLPWRTAAPKKNTSNQKAVFEYGQNGCDPKVGKPENGVSGAFIPCRTGAVHMKTAWVQLNESEISADPPRYHTTTALFYKTPAENQTCIAVETFGLVGLHAIQRVKTESSTHTPENPGGAFVFATWEHRSILPPPGSGSPEQEFQYVNLLTNPTFGSTKAGEPFPALAKALDVERMVPTGGIKEAETTCHLSAEQTCQVNAAAAELLAGTVWSNYRLVGTQFAPSTCSFTEGSRASEQEQLAQCRFDSLAQLGQPHFLANVVIETNQGLQHFLGLPPEQPRLQPFNWCQLSATNSAYCDNQALRIIGPNTTSRNGNLAFARGVHNMTYGGHAKNMGGCQGCHGVAQQNGYSFSFVLLDGVGGALPDTEQDADIPATAIAQSVPIRLQSITDPTKYLAIGELSTKFPKYYELALTDEEGATQWTLQPYTNTPGFGNFAGELILADVGGKGVLQLGKTGGGFGSGEGTNSGAGTDTSALVGPIDSGSSSRAAETQSLFLVKYQGPQPGGGALTEPYSFVSVAETTPQGASQGVHFLLTANSVSGEISAAPAAAIPTGKGGSTAFEQQVFNIEVVPAKGP